MLEQFKIAKLKIDLIAGGQGLELPAYKGSTFRGGFGHIFRKVTCSQKSKVCNDCLLNSTCSYAYIFETPLPPGSEALRSYDSIPRPFVIEPPDDTKVFYKPGESLSLYVVLIGNAIRYLPYFIISFEGLGQAGLGKGRKQYQLRKVYAQTLSQGDYQEVYDSNEGKLKEPIPIIKGANSANIKSLNRIKVSFNTVSRLKYDGRYINKVDFHVLARNLLRRISSLAYFHHGWHLEADIRDLIEQATKVTILEDRTHWVDWRRYSSRQDSRINMGGIVGEITYEGDLTPFHELLKLGEFIHVGKGAVFGMGKYTIVCENP